MKEKNISSICEEIKLIDILLKLERHSSANASRKTTKQDIREYKAQRQICEMLDGIDVEKYDSSLYRLRLPLK